MSLILDALRRADSERERGSVPGLHAQPAPPRSVEAAPRPRLGPRQWIAIGVVAGLVLALVWYLVGREAPRGPTDVAASKPATLPTAASAPRRAVAEAPATPVAAAPPRINAAELPVVAEPAPWPQPETRAAAAKAPAAAATPGRVETKAQQADVKVEQAEAKAAQPAVAAPTEAPIFAREQLPQSIQAELPALTIGGSMYSTNAANRSLIINGRLYRENDQLTANLLLEQIKLKAAVLKYKGYRFEIQF